KILRGGGSGGIEHVPDYDRLNYLLRVAKDKGVDKLLLQEYISGRVYSVDILSDLQGRVVAAVPKLILDTNGSVALSAQLQPYPAVEDLAKKTADTFKLRGLSNIDIIEDQEGKLYVIDINPRISGSLDLLLEANINLFYGLLQILAGRDPRDLHFDVPNGIASDGAFHPYPTERIENMSLTDERLAELKNYEGKIVIVNDERVLLKSVLSDNFIYMKVNIQFTEAEMDKTDARLKDVRYEDIRKDLEYVHIETSPYQNTIIRDLSKRIIFSSIGGERKVVNDNIYPGQTGFDMHYDEIRAAEAKVKE
ncbi:ATP-grasp domain-containing protein, partial [Candidatus Woesearchaeota archaeon]|nr:ATP-grasp domain-containing protein [Candidatus Woesearchaeota archaeon]